MIFTKYPITLEDIRAVCGKFNEGLRVEYKRDLDSSVRGKLAKIVSSFANSHGGVLIIGIDTVNGVPQPPFDGFQPAPREEFPLTVENLCLQGINPPVLPRTHVIASDKPDHVILAIEVDESGDAPHAIENSTKVYVRTGSASNPYEFATIELIVDLMQRRKEPLERLDRIQSGINDRAMQYMGSQNPYVRVRIAPSFPRAPLCSAAEVMDFVEERRFQAPLLIEPSSMNKRVSSGVANISSSSVQGTQYLEINKYGILSNYRRLTLVRDVSQTEPIIRIDDVVEPLASLIRMADLLYLKVGYSGALVMDVLLANVRHKVMPIAVPIGSSYLGDEFRSLTDTVAVDRTTDVITIRSDRKIQDLTETLLEIVWSFWQKREPLPDATIQATVSAACRRTG